MEWGKHNHIVFENTIDEMITFTRRQKLDRKRKITETRITVYEYTMEFNTEMTSWLGVYLDTELQFQANKNPTLEIINRIKNTILLKSYAGGRQEGSVLNGSLKERRSGER